MVARSELFIHDNAQVREQEASFQGVFLGDSFWEPILKIREQLTQEGIKKKAKVVPIRRYKRVWRREEAILGVKVYEAYQREPVPNLRNLAGQYEISESTISRVVDKLERLGLIVKARAHIKNRYEDYFTQNREEVAAIPDIISGLGVSRVRAYQLRKKYLGV